jgi:hypothetical protein
VAVVVAVVVAVSRMEMTMNSRSSGMKMITLSIRHPFVSHIVINYLKTEKCLFIQTNFLLLLWHTFIQRSNC